MTADLLYKSIWKCPRDTEKKCSIYLSLSDERDVIKEFNNNDSAGPYKDITTRVLHVNYKLSDAKDGFHRCFTMIQDLL
jgi:hypothetical protein